MPPRKDLGDTFPYGTPQRRSRRKGVWLRVKELPNDVDEYFRSRMRPEDRLSHVVVSQIKVDGVVLEAWCTDPNKFKIKDNEVWTVIIGRFPENPDWICEKYLGVGPRDASYYPPEERKWPKVEKQGGVE